jgi:putative ABC transport system permease protein
VAQFDEEQSFFVHQYYRPFDWMAACLLILQYVSFELSFDQFNKNADDTYRVYNDRYQEGKLVQHGTITYSGIGKAMQDDFPES